MLVLASNELVKTQQGSSMRVYCSPKVRGSGSNLYNSCCLVFLPVDCRGPRGVLTGGGDLPPGYLENYEVVKPRPKPDAQTLRQQADLPDFAGGGAPDPRQDRER